VLEVGKLVTAAWLHQNWKKTRWWMKTYLTASVFVLMIITSLGIFGFLSKAHLEHSVSIGGTNEIQIENLERRIRYQQGIITDAETVLGQLDATVQTLLDYDRVRGKDGALAVRERQGEERESLNSKINDAYDSIEGLQVTLTPLLQDRLAIEVEVGPLKYIAELIYGDKSEDYFDEAVRAVILLLIVTFDPLAVVLLLAATQGFEDRRKSNVFYEDGSHRVDPTNVVDIENIYEPPVEDWPDRDQPNIVEVDMGDYTIVEDDIPEDEDMEVITGVNLEEDIDILPNETPEERQIRLEKYLYGEDERGVPKMGIRKVKD